jgi:chromosome segregation ATPase
MEQEQMVNEYINTLAKKYNDASLEVVTLQARNSLLSKEKEQLLNKIETITKDMHDLENELQEERNKPPVTQTEIKEVEVVKEVLVHEDETLVKENEVLKKELHALEEKIKKLREEKSNGNNSQAQKVRDS